MVKKDEGLEMIRDALNIEERMMKIFKEEFFKALDSEIFDEGKKTKLKQHLLVLSFETLAHERALNELYLRLLSGEEL